MKAKILILVTVLSSLFALAQVKKTKAPLFTVSGKVTQTSSYCGGARPSEEMMEEYNKPKPYAGKVLYIRKGKVNSTKNSVLLKIVADSAGSFTFKLSPGIYVLIQEEQVKSLNIKKIPTNRFIQVDNACLKKWWNEPLALLEIKDKDPPGINVNFHHRCFVNGDIPCMTYTGPMPP